MTDILRAAPTGRSLRTSGWPFPWELYLSIVFNTTGHIRYFAYLLISCLPHPPVCKHQEGGNLSWAQISLLEWMKGWEEALARRRLGFVSLPDLRVYLLTMYCIVHPGSHAYTGSRPASSPTLTSASPAHLLTPLQPALRALHGIPTYHPNPLALVLLGCTHTFFKGEKSPPGMGFLFH